MPQEENLAPLRSATGMMELWNVGIMDFGRLEYWKFLKTVLIIPYKRDKIPLLLFTIPVFHHSIIPGWNKQNGWVVIPYYQAFLKIPIHYYMYIVVKK
jgi:hypothetical protein